MLSTEDATSAAALNDALGRTKSVVTGLALKIGGALVPLFRSFRRNRFGKPPEGVFAVAHPVLATD